MDFKWEDLVIVANSVPNGVVCFISALAIYEFTDEVPRRHWIAVPNSTTTPKGPLIRAIRMRDTTTGKTTLKLGREKITIFSRERTIVDAFRYLSIEVAIKALKIAVASRHRLDLVLLQKYAKRLRVPIAPYLLTVTT